MTNEPAHADEPAADNEHAEAADAGTPRRRRTKAIVWATASVVATAIGAAAIAVPMIADAQKRSTSTDTLVLNPTSEPQAAALPTSEPIAASVDLGLDFTETTESAPEGAHTDMTFWVPVDAPWETFPDDGWQEAVGNSTYGCSQAQYDWLVDHEVSEATGGGLYDFANSATDGGALAIRSIRAEGEFVRQTPARVLVHCEGGGSGAGDEYTVVEVVLGADAPATVVASSVLPVGTLFTRDLAPGEVGTIFIEVRTLDPEQDFEGRIVADVVAGTEESTVTIEEGFIWRSAPAVRSGQIRIGSVDGALSCVTMPVTYPLFEDGVMGGPYSTLSYYDPAAVPTPCTPTELATWVKGLAVEY